MYEILEPPRIESDEEGLFFFALFLLFKNTKRADVFSFILSAGDLSAKKESETSPTAAESANSGEAGGEAEGSASKDKEGETGEPTEKAATAPASQGLFSTWNSVIGAGFFFNSLIFHGTWIQTVGGVWFSASSWLQT